MSHTQPRRELVREMSFAYAATGDTAAERAACTVGWRQSFALVKLDEADEASLGMIPEDAARMVEVSQRWF